MAVTEYALADIVRVQITTEEATPVDYRLTDLANEATIEAHVSEGEETPLRIKNTIKALSKTENIVTGYDITLNTVVMIPEVLALVDGGTWTALSSIYTAPTLGTSVNRKSFTIKIYTAQKDSTGAITGYVEFEFENCKGTPVNYSFSDGEFYTQELVAQSRPANGSSPITITHMTTLPA